MDGNESAVNVSIARKIVNGENRRCGKESWKTPTLTFKKQPEKSRLAKPTKVEPCRGRKEMGRV